jgi:hypothetical protein
LLTIHLKLGGKVWSLTGRIDSKATLSNRPDRHPSCLEGYYGFIGGKLSENPARKATPKD